jgi:Rrf2 family protein
MLSSKARYGLKAMAALARREASGSLTSVEIIAAEENIPVKFLEAILTQLKKAGLLESRRGPSGGFMLLKPADEISLALVIRILDGPFAPTPCARTRNPVVCEGCDDLKSCQLRPFMREVRDVMADVWEHRTVHDLVDGYARLKRRSRAAM